MGKALVITEKPSVARDIVAALGGFREVDGYWEGSTHLVTFSVGHIVELLAPEDIDPVYKRWTLDTLPILPQEFKLKQKSGASERVRTIKKLLARKDVERVINACDAGREGELIFREILEFLGCQMPVERLWLQSMTHDAIREGFSRLEDGSRYDTLGAAAACRSRSDWLIGMNATRALTRRLQGRRERTAWSAGRVQTPTLAILVGRELEILSHVPVPYWRIEARFTAEDHEYAATYFHPRFRAAEGKPEQKDDRIFDELHALAIARAVDGQMGSARESRKPSRETAPPLFDLTSLQREGNRRFGWSAKRTLNAAQRCYEVHKILTYPRTDSRCLPMDYRAEVDGILRRFATQSPFRAEAARLLENGLQNERRTFDDSKVSDHFAIIPTGKLPEGELRGDDARLFDLVSRRFLASFYPPAIWQRVERVTEVAGHSFRSRSRTLEVPGWRAVLGQIDQEDQALPPLRPGSHEVAGVGVTCNDVDLLAEKTRPPAHITEARLLSLMENAGQYVEDEDAADAMRERGIGTPATRADIIENLLLKGYVVRMGKALRPTVKGIRLIDVLRRIHIDRLSSPELTGEMEHDLQRVQHGELSADAFMREIVEYTSEIVDKARSFDYEDLYPDENPLGPCPGCGRPVYERSWFYRCKEVPDVTPEEDCPFRLWKDKAGRYLDRHTAQLLVEKGEAGPLDGFMYRDGRTYSGILKLEGMELKLIREAGSEGDRITDLPEYEVDDTPLGPCPRDHGSEIVETATHYVCRSALEKREGGGEGDPPCPFVLPRTVCRREITREEAEQYVRSGATEMLSDFISRRGRPFSAKLFHKENGRHGFEFAQRTGGGRKKTTRKKATRKKTTRKKTTRKKAAAKKTTRKKTGTRKKATAPRGQ
ncbi:MAG: DNA topoisomerase 3 [Myxococcota bacterium]